MSTYAIPSDPSAQQRAELLTFLKRQKGLSADSIHARLSTFSEEIIRNVLAISKLPTTEAHLLVEHLQRRELTHRSSQVTGQSARLDEVQVVVNHVSGELLRARASEAEFQHGIAAAAATAERNRAGLDALAKHAQAAADANRQNAKELDALKAQEAKISEGAKDLEAKTAENAAKAEELSRPVSAPSSFDHLKEGMQDLSSQAAAAGKGLLDRLTCCAKETLIGTGATLGSAAIGGIAGGVATNLAWVGLTSAAGGAVLGLLGYVAIRKACSLCSRSTSNKS